MKLFHELQNSFFYNIMILKALRHVNYNLLQVLRMEKGYQTGLKLKNNLSSELEQFVPADGKNVLWYTCGPTVYSNSHMGHARNYICNDMIRRILTNHFGYNVKFGMNVTDIDDKIINSSNLEKIQYYEFAKKWEADFFEDMDTLGVDRPDYLTRVTQYIPEIVNFIQKVIQNGYAYQSKGSVYFNIEEYRKKFKYGKLKRIKQAETQQQQKDQKGQKRNKEDFALWKAAKQGEPTWDSKWGKGRPGWHIECSAMATQLFGKNLDIHSGGIDLVFPHHQNQLAQTQAYNNQANWVKYFIHVGHLHIKGLKMARSLKNFITIKELVKEVSPRVIKLFFAMHKYDAVLDYDPEKSLQQANIKDKRYKNFFGSLKTSIRTSPISKPQKLDQTDLQFDKILEITKAKINEQFCHNFHTPGVIQVIDEAIKKTNIYSQSPSAKVTLLLKAMNTLNKPFESMGLFYTEQQSTKSKQLETIDAIVKFRSQIRKNAKSQFNKILQICDKFRDQDMVQLGIRLQDKQVTQPSTWRFQSKQILIKQRQKKVEQKFKKEEQARKKQQQKLNKMKQNPLQMFKKQAKYTQFDENGIPTHEKAKQGDKPLKQQFRKKLLKQWTEQKGLYDKYLAQYGNAEEKKQQKQKQKVEEKEQANQKKQQ